MKSKLLLYLTFIILFLILTNVLADTYSTKIERVIDGDTVEINIPCLPESLQKMKVRLKNIDTPEIHGKCDIEKIKAEQAKQILIQKLENKVVELKNCEPDKYFRLNCEVIYDGVRNISSDMIINGYGVPYHGERKSYSWCSDESK